MPSLGSWHVLQSAARPVVGDTAALAGKVIRPDVELQGLHPRTHLTWTKVRLLNGLLNGLPDGHAVAPAGYTHIVWLDADAVVVKPDVTV